MNLPSEITGEPGRLDQVVTAALGVPRADVQRAIKAGRILVDGAARPKSFRLEGGERISVDLPTIDELAKEGPPLRIVFEDRYLAVVSKPAGLITHPTQTLRTNTMVNRLLGMDIPLSSIGAPLRPGIVHRLDAGTSGLVIVAKDDETHEALAAMMHDHLVERRYLALVRGKVDHERFVVDAPLQRRRAKIVVKLATGKPAETSFEVRERFERATLLEAAPRTGRTHQIRVHLSAIGHPVLGDRAYGGGGDDAKVIGLSRPFLHAWKLAFDHPRTGQRIELEDPLPDDLESALGRIRGEA
jgi:23S rRNA pseudouridine1911/1915/1917 synthase